MTAYLDGHTPDCQCVVHGRRARGHYCRQCAVTIPQSDDFCGDHVLKSLYVCGCGFQQVIEYLTLKAWRTWERVEHDCPLPPR